MGFLGEILGEVAKEVAVNVGADVLDSAAETLKGVSEKAGGFFESASESIKLRKANELDRYQDKMENKHPEHLRIWMLEESRVESKKLLKSSTEIIYKLLDVNGTQLYHAVFSKQKGENFLTLYNNNGYEVGGIIGTRTNKKTSFAVKNDDPLVEMEMFYKDQPAGLITNNVFRGKWFLSWDVSNWGAVRKKLGVVHIVADREDVVAEITTKTFNSNKLTFLDVSKSNSEVAVILFALAINVFNEIK